jgi:hypothetical protein
VAEAQLGLAALDYARRGWPVFPCRPGGKVPATPHGCKDATTDLDQITAWWWRNPDANIGIATGTPGPDVLDVDTKNGAPGYATLNRLTRAGLVAGAHRLVRTPSGGLHLYYAGSGQGNGTLAKHGIDFRGAGGYVLAPPSTLDGNAYELIDDRAETGRHLDQGAVRCLLNPPVPLVARRSTPAGLNRLAEWVAAQPAGNRNNGLYWAARAAHDDGHDDLTALVDAAVAAGLAEHEATRTVASAQRGSR